MKVKRRVPVKAKVEEPKRVVVRRKAVKIVRKKEIPHMKFKRFGLEVQPRLPETGTGCFEAVDTPQELQDKISWWKANWKMYGVRAVGSKPMFRISERVGKKIEYKYINWNGARP